MLAQPNHLNSLLRQTEEAVERLDPRGADADEFGVQLAAARTDLLSAMAPADANVVTSNLSRCNIKIIKEIPAIVEAMLSAIDRRTTEPAVRCALAGALAYLVKPRDLLPDELPGGYGLVDDCMILRATISEFMDFLPAGFTDTDREKKMLRILATSVPPQRIPEFQSEVQGIWLAFHSSLWVPEEDVVEMTERMLQDPLGTPLPSPKRDSIPLPPEPRISMAPGQESITLEADGSIKVEFDRGDSVRIDSDGDLLAAD